MVVASGCIKSSNESTVNNDGTAAVKVSLGYKKEVVANLKSMIEAQMGGEEDGEGPEFGDAFAKFEAGFDEKKVVEEWKKLGIEVSKATTTDKDGWKKVEVEGTVKNVPEYARKHAEAMKKMQADSEAGPMGAMSGLDPSKFSLPTLPRFYKTDQPNVAKVMLVSDQAAADRDMPDMEDLDDETREQMEASLDQMRMMFGLDDLKIELRVKLPGKILSVSNAKQVGENEIVFEVLGSNMTADTMADMAKTKGQLTATLQFDPKEFKIPLEDAPKAESKPASRPTPPAPKKDEEEKKKTRDEDE
jgi:hypothetical protein